MELRVAFRLPFNCTTPVELVKYGAVYILSIFRKEKWLINWIEIMS
jgi:hypothetical protein